MLESPVGEGIKRSRNRFHGPRATAKGPLSMDIVMWVILFAASLGLLGYLVISLIHPEKW
ncbi:potassium-transporting ATPase subunit F [Micrococcales bacterium 31B]|nr:potassium-transporting ATPase subunit F [Micrococcales bacterium 31B]